jgi:hypothetical protein
MDDKKYDFAKVSVRPATKREIDVLAAMHQQPVYEIVAEMLEAWKVIKTDVRVVALCEAYEMGNEGQTELIRKLVGDEYEKLAAVKLVRPLPVSEQETDPGKE